MIDGGQIREQLNSQRRKVDYDSYDVTIDELVRRVGSGRIEVAPVYQRQFRWDATRQSTLIESFLLGVPVPPLYMATNSPIDEVLQWEVVDGLQRLLTLVNFLGEPAARVVTGQTKEPLHLSGLEKLPLLNGLSFPELPTDIQFLLRDRPAKVIVLNDKSSKQVRFDLFERLNTGGLKLTDQEVRECVFRGAFVDFITEISSDKLFRQVVNIPNSKIKDGTPQEMALRFFAYLENYTNFDHSVKDFLNQYTESASMGDLDKDKRNEEFYNTFKFLSHSFPDGIRRNSRTTTPVNLFEGIAVGAALALRQNPDLQPRVNPTWITSDKMTAATTGATNSRGQVRRRIEIARDQFLGQ